MFVRKSASMRCVNNCKTLLAQTHCLTRNIQHHAMTTTWCHRLEKSTAASWIRSGLTGFRSTRHGPLHLCFGGLWRQRKGKKASFREKELHLMDLSIMAFPCYEGTSKVGSSMPSHLAETEALQPWQGLRACLQEDILSGDASTKPRSGTVSMSVRRELRES